jgi:drug efflux transport system permease protein
MGPRLTSLILKEFIQFSRNRVVLVLILFLYTGEVVNCTIALSYDVKHLPLAILDFDRTQESRSLERSFLAGDEFKLVGHPASEAEAGDMLQSGRASVAVILPAGFARDLARGTPASIQILLDGTNSNTAAIARGYALGVLDLFERSLSNIAGTAAAAVRPVLRVWYNPDLTFTRFMVLSMIGAAALMIGVIQPAASIVHERELGTIEQLMVTPITTGELFLAKTLPTLLMGLLAVFPSLLIAWWFEVPLRGSLLLFLALTALYLLSAIGIGVLVAAVTRTLQQALLLGFFGLFPIMFLSGTFVPIKSMPVFLQRLSLLSPVRYYTDIILGVFLKGAGLAELWPQTLALLGIGSVLFGCSLLVFRRQ